MLPATDQTFLETRFTGHAVSTEGGFTCVVIPNFALPAGFDRQQADLLLRLSVGYPDVPPDMWWFSPAIHRSDGMPIPCTQVQERHLAREWQRWSRHLGANQWRSGIDSLESYVALVRRELDVARPPITS